MFEIGSEFNTNSFLMGKNKYFEISNFQKRYVLSGRTGLYLIAKELDLTISKIAVPAYCCSSMVAPFVACGKDISFYNSFDLERVSLEGEQAVLIMDYFGFLSKKSLQFAKKCKQAGLVVIVDATQTAFSKSKTYELADYIVISYRKWLDSLCAVVYSKNGFRNEEYKNEHSYYESLWRNGAKLKLEYLNGNCVNKQEFLAEYAKANQLLNNEYANYTANLLEIEIIKNVSSRHIRSVRRKNAKFLMSNVMRLEKRYNVKLMFSKLGKEDCPLFVPILVDEEKRNQIRSELVKNDVYCPIHWAIDNDYPYQKTQTHKEQISLICDQRYGKKQMKIQIAVLEQALENLVNHN